MELRFCVEDWENTPHIHAKELVRRLLARFPAMVVDWEKGEAYVQAGLDQLAQRGVPEVILQSQMSYSGNTVFVAASEPGWSGAAVTAYLFSIRPPLGDHVLFAVVAPNETTTQTVANDLMAALGMKLCPDPIHTTG